MNALPCTIYVCFAGALLALMAGARSAAAARWVALLTALTTFALALFAGLRFEPAAGLRLLVDVPWIEELGIRYHLAVDGLSLALVVLTGLAAIAGVLFSWNITHRTGEFFALYLTLLGGVFGVFLSVDAFTLFVFYEIAIVPKYFLIAIWGSPATREHAAMKLVLYSFAGSALVLAGLLGSHAAAYRATDVNTFDLAELALLAPRLSAGEQIALFALVFTGFAVLAGLFPFHTWAPTGHSAAPTAASMLLAGVVMKLGAYGCLRVALTLFPAGFAFWQPVIAGLALTGILYAGFVALVQDDFKFVIGYSSVSHMGFVLLGLAAGEATAAAGAALQMVSHGIVAGLLFAVVGRIVYERTHTRQLADLRALPLYRLLPFAAIVFVLGGLASMGMPGFSGFPAELLILIGTWKTSPAWAAFAVVGVLIAAAFTLRAVHLAFFGSTTCATPAHAYAPITVAEKVGASLLIAATVYLGLKPDVLLDWIVPALQSPLLQATLKGGAP